MSYDLFIASAAHAAAEESARKEIDHLRRRRCHQYPIWSCPVWGFVILFALVIGFCFWSDWYEHKDQCLIEFIADLKWHEVNHVDIDWQNRSGSAYSKEYGRINFFETHGYKRVNDKPCEK